MSTINKFRPLVVTLGTGLALSISSAALAASSNTLSSDNPFASQKLSSGYQQGNDAVRLAEGKCGDAKCGADKKKDGKCGDGKCGADKDKSKDDNAGADKEKSNDGKCGTGKCGS